MALEDHFNSSAIVYRALDSDGQGSVDHFADGTVVGRLNFAGGADIERAGKLGWEVSHVFWTALGSNIERSARLSIGGVAYSVEGTSVASDATTYEKHFLKQVQRG
jgi:hypothetical protein